MFQDLYIYSPWIEQLEDSQRVSRTWNNSHLEIGVMFSELNAIPSELWQFSENSRKIFSELRSIFSGLHTLLRDLNNLLEIRRGIFKQKSPEIIISSNFQFFLFSVQSQYGSNQRVGEWSQSLQTSPGILRLQRYRKTWRTHIWLQFEGRSLQTQRRFEVSLRRTKLPRPIMIFLGGSS